jgi:hypothetical protein
MELNMKKGKPRENDQFRVGIITPVEVKESQGLSLSHKREESLCKFHSFGLLSKERFINDFVVTAALHKLIQDHIEDVETTLAQ